MRRRMRPAHTPRRGAALYAVLAAVACIPLEVADARVATFRLFTHGLPEWHSDDTFTFSVYSEDPLTPLGTSTIEAPRAGTFTFTEVDIPDDADDNQVLAVTITHNEPGVDSWRFSYMDYMMHGTWEQWKIASNGATGAWVDNTRTKGLPSQDLVPKDDRPQTPAPVTLAPATGTRTVSFRVFTHNQPNWGSEDTFIAKATHSGLVLGQVTVVAPVAGDFVYVDVDIPDSYDEWAVDGLILEHPPEGTDPWRMSYVQFSLDGDWEPWYMPATRAEGGWLDSTAVSVLTFAPKVTRAPTPVPMTHIPATGTHVVRFRAYTHSWDGWASTDTFLVKVYHQGLLLGEGAAVAPQGDAFTFIDVDIPNSYSDASVDSIEISVPTEATDPWRMTVVQYDFGGTWEGWYIPSTGAEGAWLDADGTRKLWFTPKETRPPPTAAPPTDVPPTPVPTAAPTPIKFRFYSHGLNGWGSEDTFALDIYSGDTVVAQTQIVAPQGGAMTSIDVDLPAPHGELAVTGARVRAPADGTDPWRISYMQYYLAGEWEWWAMPSNGARGAWVDAAGTAALYFEPEATRPPTPAPEGQTDPPDTPGPPTTVPPTPVPSTAAPPPTDVPPTPTPPTPAPPTDIPPTDVPSTPSPPSPVPATPPPPTLSPPTDIPDTDAPATPVPTTPEPSTAVPATIGPTPAPDTPEPATEEPAPPGPPQETAVPSTAAPATAVPVTSVPATAVPVTSVPATLLPTTFEPPTGPSTTPEPSTVEPATGKPSTPSPPAPTTPVQFRFYSHGLNGWGSEDTFALDIYSGDTVVAQTQIVAPQGGAMTSIDVDLPAPHGELAVTGARVRAPADGTDPWRISYMQYYLAGEWEWWAMPSNGARGAWVDAAGTAALYFEPEATRPPTPAPEEPSTSAPATQAPPTEAPPTQAPSTETPSTAVPDTPVPVGPVPTLAPPTARPTTGLPTTGSPATGDPKVWFPGTGEPSTGVPTTGTPATAAPPTYLPNTAVPSTGVPGVVGATGVPNTAAPFTYAPPTAAPTTGNPLVPGGTGEPGTAAPPTDMPTPVPPTPAPPTAEPSTGVPTTGTPTTGAPSLFVPTTGRPTTGRPTTGVPNTAMPPGATREPLTGTPATEVPATLTQPPPSPAPPSPAPQTSLPSTSAPPTLIPATAAPQTPIPRTEAPPTEAPPTGAPPTQTPPTEAPPTVAPPTEAPPTQTPPTQAPRTQTPPTPLPGTFVPTPTVYVYITPPPQTPAPPTPLPPPSSAPSTFAPTPTIYVTVTPGTPSPPTPHPATDIPATPAPPPPTAVPPIYWYVTPAPPTPAPPTPEPTPAPPTPAPLTAVPPIYWYVTPVPTPAPPPPPPPPTAVPPIRWYVTPAPLTDAPPTLAPTPTIYVTPEPQTEVPETGAPYTGTPPTLVPTPTIFVTGEPHTAAPPTGEPPTLAPTPTIYVTPEPTTGVPETSVPATAAPSPSPTAQPSTATPAPHGAGGGGRNVTVTTSPSATLTTPSPGPPGSAAPTTPGPAEAPTCVVADLRLPNGVHSSCEDKTVVTTGVVCTSASDARAERCVAVACEAGGWNTTEVTCEPLTCAFDSIQQRSWRTASGEDAPLMFNGAAGCGVDGGIVANEGICDVAAAGYDCASILCDGGSWRHGLPVMCTPHACSTRAIRDGFDTAWAAGCVPTMFRDTVPHNATCTFVREGYVCDPLTCVEGEWTLGGDVACTALPPAGCAASTLPRYYRGGATGRVPVDYNDACVAHAADGAGGGATQVRHPNGTACTPVLPGYTCEDLVCADGTWGTVACSPATCDTADLANPLNASFVVGTACATTPAAVPHGAACAAVVVKHTCAAAVCTYGAWVTPVVECTLDPPKRCAFADALAGISEALESVSGRTNTDVDIDMDIDSPRAPSFYTGAAGCGDAAALIPHGGACLGGLAGHTCIEIECDDGAWIGGPGICTPNGCTYAALDNPSGAVPTGACAAAAGADAAPHGATCGFAVEGSTCGEVACAYGEWGMPAVACDPAPCLAEDLPQYYTVGEHTLQRLLYSGDGACAPTGLAAASAGITGEVAHGGACIPALARWTCSPVVCLYGEWQRQEVLSPSRGSSSTAEPLVVCTPPTTCNVRDIYDKYRTVHAGACAEATGLAVDSGSACTFMRDGYTCSPIRCEGGMWANDGVVVCAEVPETPMPTTAVPSVVPPPSPTPGSPSPAARDPTGTPSSSPGGGDLDNATWVAPSNGSGTGVVQNVTDTAGSAGLEGAGGDADADDAVDSLLWYIIALIVVCAVCLSCCIGLWCLLRRGRGKAPLRATEATMVHTTYAKLGGDNENATAVAHTHHGAGGPRHAGDTGSLCEMLAHSSSLGSGGHPSLMSQRDVDSACPDSKGGVGASFISKDYADDFAGMSTSGAISLSPVPEPGQHGGGAGSNGHANPLVPGGGPHGKGAGNGGTRSLSPTLNGVVSPTPPLGAARLSQLGVLPVVTRLGGACTETDTTPGDAWSPSQSASAGGAGVVAAAALLPAAASDPLAVRRTLSPTHSAGGACDDAAAGAAPASGSAGPSRDAGAGHTPGTSEAKGPPPSGAQNAGEAGGSKPSSRVTNALVGNVLRKLASLADAAGVDGGSRSMLPFTRGSWRGAGSSSNGGLISKKGSLYRRDARGGDALVNDGFDPSEYDEQSVESSSVANTLTLQQTPGLPAKRKHVEGRGAGADGVEETLRLSRRKSSVLRPPANSTVLPQERCPLSTAPPPIRSGSRVGTSFRQRGSSTRQAGAPASSTPPPPGWRAPYQHQRSLPYYDGAPGAVDMNAYGSATPSPPPPQALAYTIPWADDDEDDDDSTLLNWTHDGGDVDGLLPHDGHSHRRHPHRRGTVGNFPSGGAPWDGGGDALEHGVRGYTPSLGMSVQQQQQQQQHWGRRGSYTPPRLSAGDAFDLDADLDHGYGGGGGGVRDSGHGGARQPGTTPPGAARRVSSRHTPPPARRGSNATPPPDPRTVAAFAAAAAAAARVLAPVDIADAESSGEDSEGSLSRSRGGQHHHHHRGHSKRDSRGDDRRRSSTARASPPPAMVAVPRRASTTTGHPAASTRKLKTRQPSLTSTHPRRGGSYRVPNFERVRAGGHSGEDRARHHAFDPTDDPPPPPLMPGMSGARLVPDAPAGGSFSEVHL